MRPPLHAPRSLRLAAIAGLVFGVTLFGCREAHRRSEPVPVSAIGRRATLVDEAPCRQCHPAQAGPYQQSAHALTSQAPTATAIRGRFLSGENTMTTSDPSVSFVMEATAEGFFETAVVTTPTRTFKRRERIDLVVGSGRKGQTFLFWEGDQLFELPVSCWTKTGEWMNSPGYPDGTANFDRGVSDRCLECHATSFTSLAPPHNRFKRDSLVSGLACQRCHGPGGEHASRFAAGRAPAAAGATAIVNPAKLSRARQMDLCSLCHAGVGRALAPPLSYVAGESLGNFLVVAPAAPEVHLDPHGSQVQALTLSRCYQASRTLTCLTCHNVHQTQRQPAEFAAQCVACHRIESCGKFPDLGHAIDRSCVDCHMPLETTAKIVLRINGRRVQPQVRNHRIGVHPNPPAP